MRFGMTEQVPNTTNPDSNPVRRRRFIEALEHREPDHVPILFGGPCCSIHRLAQQRLLDYLDYGPAEGSSIMDSILQIVEPDERLYEALNVDVQFLVPREGPNEWEGGNGAFVDQFGRRFIACGEFYSQVDHPLKQGSTGELERYRFPEVRSYACVTGLRDRARRLYEAGYGLVADGPWGIYEISSSLRGTEDFFSDMVVSAEYAAAVAERVLEEHLKPYYTMLLGEVGPWVQMVVISDDYGSQQSLLFSPEIFRRIFKPRLRRLVDHIRTLADVKVYIHSDGAISRIIPDFIEIGLDGINPVQYTARGMEAVRLKREFGKDLGFFGGAIDNEILSFKSTEEVRRDVRRQIAALAPGGGFLFATIHNISPETPAENALACFHAGAEFGA